MAKKIKEKRNKKAKLSLKERKSEKLRKYSLILMLILGLLVSAFGVYIYMTTTSYQSSKTVKKEQMASSTELMRKMKQMLDDEKVRQATIPKTPLAPSAPPVVEKVIESNQTLQKHTETNQTVLLSNPVIESNQTTNVPPVVTHDDETKMQELSEVHDYQRSLKEAGKHVKPSEVVRKKYPAGTVPKLAIIIDDVSFPWQTRMIKEIPYKVTPAFFPPTKGHPETVRLSHEFPFAMVHLPLEAKYFSRPEEDTLTITDSIEVIERRIKRIKEWFPQISYYNNHTGGYYTADYNAMDRLIKVMKKYNLNFVDSRTIGNTKAPEITKKYGMFLYSRDVFLDNSLEKHLIRKQLQEAVMKAKKHGYAIAIGHPRKNTLEVLKDSQDILQGVDLVYLKDL